MYRQPRGGKKRTAPATLPPDLLGSRLKCRGGGVGIPEKRSWDECWIASPTLATDDSSPTHREAIRVLAVLDKRNGVGKTEEGRTA